MNKILILTGVAVVASLAGAGIAYQALTTGKVAAAETDSASVTSQSPQNINMEPASSADASTNVDPQAANDLAAAKTACKNADFNNLFDLMVRSKAVRTAYSADNISIVAGTRSIDKQTDNSTTTISREKFNDFPIALIDNQFVYAPTAMRNGRLNENTDRLDVQFNQGQSSDFVVDWEQVRLSDNPGEDNEFGTIVARYGDSGTLYFKPTASCWVLSEVRTYKNPPGDRQF